MSIDTTDSEPLQHEHPPHPFAELIGLQVDATYHHASDCSLTIKKQLTNPHGVAHGAALYAMADTGMGAALAPSLEKGQICATIEIKFNYYKAIREGTVRCHTTVLNRGKRIANLESRLTMGEDLIASANGSYAIFMPGQRHKS